MLQSSTSWQEQNPEYEYTLYDHADARSFVHEHHPGISGLYDGLRHDIQRADLFRYLVVWSRGGVYADIDTICQVPLRLWLSPLDRLVVGLESDLVSQEDATYKGIARECTIAQYIFAATPGHTALRSAVYWMAKRVHRSGMFMHDPDIHDVVTGSKGQNKGLLSKKGAGFYAVLGTSGPGLWTDVLLQYWLQQTSMDATSATDQGRAQQGSEDRLPVASGGAIRAMVRLTGIGAVDELPAGEVTGVDAAPMGMRVLPVQCFGSNTPHSNSGSRWSGEEQG
jgi:hypothetical protein